MGTDVDRQHEQRALLSILTRQAEDWIRLAEWKSETGSVESARWDYCAWIIATDQLPAMRHAWREAAWLRGRREAVEAF